MKTLMLSLYKVMAVLISIKDSTTVAANEDVILLIS
jgi:hypothetical protein